MVVQFSQSNKSHFLIFLIRRHFCTDIQHKYRKQRDPSIRSAQASIIIAECDAATKGLQVILQNVQKSKESLLEVDQAGQGHGVPPKDRVTVH